MCPSLVKLCSPWGSKARACFFKNLALGTYGGGRSSPPHSSPVENFSFSSKQKECLTLCLWKCLSSLAINPRVTLYKNKGKCTHCVRPCFYFAYTLRLILPTEVHSLTSQYSLSCGAKAPRSGDALRACGLELSH